MAILPDFLATETESTILQRMLARVDDGIDKNEGSYIYDALAAATADIAQMKIDMGQYLSRGFASTTFGQYLDLRCQEHGLTRKDAVSATGQVKISGTAGIPIPVGTMVATPADSATDTVAIQFSTLADLTLGVDGSGAVDIKAVMAGESGNVAAGAISVVVKSMNGVTSVTNPVPTSGGADTENDISLLSRFLAKVQNPGTSGNKADYLNWALEVPGVGGAQVIPLWNGPGTVKVVLVDSDKLPASQAIVDAVQAYIAPTDEGTGEAPIGATVTVVAATAVNIDVTATVVITGAKTIDDIKAAFKSSLADYLQGLAFAQDPTVRYVRVGSLLLDVDGIQDYSNLTLNGGSGNISINQDQVAVKGTVTLNG